MSPALAVRNFTTEPTGILQLKGKKKKERKDCYGSVALSKGSRIRHNSLNSGSVLFYPGKFFYFLIPEIGVPMPISYGKNTMR